MRKSLIVAASALVFAVGAAADKSYPRLDYDFDMLDAVGGPYEEVAQPAPRATYRPCRPGPGDDRCIQLYERGVRLAYARWLSEGAEPGKPLAETAVGGPVETRAGYPLCRRGSVEDRCIQRPGRSVAPPVTSTRDPQEGEPEGM